MILAYKVMIVGQYPYHVEAVVEIRWFNSEEIFKAHCETFKYESWKVAFDPTKVTS